ncbi:AurF N-oxygenase family protein [Gandjariella thermophila]|uniref:Membrane protein n=1 Tax=Gandjariella thermophila TaxID=1931992 RepID=A0A4D4IZF2_9PSEU|nr:diiron oxygenase [Gandjariella thermophila]GDY29631.1 membrane protein [Gandjariella thermophila]
MTGTLHGDREKVAERLLHASVRNSFDPEVDVDWAAPLDEDLFYVPPHRLSLYGTDLWHRLDHRQRVELSKHELASTASMGIWFELLLMQMLLRHVYAKDPRSRHVQYALTEIADECRHSTMFARMIERMGCPCYRPRRVDEVLAQLLAGIASGPAMWAGILLAEEILDRFQRESMVDDSVQPLVRTVNRIHVIEEARHVRYAREELVRQMVHCRGPALTYHRLMTARGAHVITHSLIHPDVYRAVGLDPRQARRAALTNPSYRDTLRWAGAKVVDFLDDAGLVGGPTRWFWRKSFVRP